MQKLVLVVLAIALGVLLGFFVWTRFVHPTSTVNPLGKLVEKPLEKYTFDTLRKEQFTGSQITLGKEIKKDPQFVSKVFYYKTQDGKKISGLMNIPIIPGVYPVLVMFRGFAPKENYTYGFGTLRTAEYFASQGFITVAPDFLGYAESDPAAQSSIEDRLRTYPTALSLLASVKNLDKTLADSSTKANVNNVAIWGHSNGGHIALSVLSITGKAYPTVLWNPVSKPFPYSVLYFTDEFDDNGKALRKVIADFEKDYDAEKFSPPNYYKNISAPIELDQAVDDEEVPLRWSDQLYNRLKTQGLDITYYTYPGENHNFNNGSWQTIVERDTAFLKEKMSK